MKNIRNGRKKIKMIEGKTFFKGSGATWEPAGEGITRKITGFNTELMMVQVKFEKGATGYVHDHFHT